ncbi:MaoC family dehydratase [Inmirania thermothiophila]|uniref:L-erythro-3-methylmalyl-CoA dehydratase n=1 Tax=Inmirania thermothiophila TaxID=1750597 RepID=A0A3N1Y1Q7_9GAMM|nr:MaoC family dehydratase [Inmirania thermothiophila]ROR32764.1 L-erythro-3-methylmalyl-CoA dehydratase [Inmirania thermothiophila]
MAADKAVRGRFFEDFRLGERIVHPTPRTVGEGEAALYLGLTGSRFPLASADTAARALGLARRPLDELLAFHVAFGKTVPDVSLNAVANLGYAEVRFLGPVWPGETLRAESEVIGLRPNRDGRAGIVWVRSRAFAQDGREVLAWVRWVMVRRRKPGGGGPEAVVPETADHVPPQALPVPEGLHGRGYDTALTGSPWLWEDYEPGERIVHPAGMTIDETDHTLATRLYQNNARVHFDAHAMASSRFGRRLVYGGHVISVCRALSFEGLANAVWIAAINGGTHANPVFAGDTLYCRSEVLARWALPGRDDLGALRVRTLGLKDCDPATVDEPRDGEGRYRPEVVLDLDYTVLMPRRR